jgi:hypothetical protein
MIVAMIPPASSTDPTLFRMKVIGGALGFVLVGGAIYGIAKTRK